MDLYVKGSSSQQPSSTLKQDLSCFSLETLSSCLVKICNLISAFFMNCCKRELSPEEALFKKKCIEPILQTLNNDLKQLKVFQPVHCDTIEYTPVAHRPIAEFEVSSCCECFDFIKRIRLSYLIESELLNFLKTKADFSFTLTYCIVKKSQPYHFEYQSVSYKQRE